MKTFRTLVIGAAVGLFASSSAHADVQLTMQNGRVTLVAKDATIRQILTEWARVGQTKIVNAERVQGGPLSIELHNVSESQALDVLLRTVAGYMAAPRPVAVANLSVFDRIVVMPAAAGPRTAVAAAVPPPIFPQQPQFNPQAADDGDDERPAPGAIGVPGPMRGPVFNTFPQQQPQLVNPQTGMPMNAPMAQPAAPQAPSAFPSAPAGGVSVPGMVAPPPPQQPGQVLMPGQVPPMPDQIRRPGAPGSR